VLGANIGILRTSRWFPPGNNVRTRWADADERFVFVIERLLLADFVAEVDEGSGEA
jgi:hypothetical protein